MEQAPNTSGEFVAMIPAAGVGSRLPHRSASKEMLRVDTALGVDAPAISHVLSCLQHSGVNEVTVVLREGKRDIERYLTASEWPQQHFSLLSTKGTGGVADTVALGLKNLADVGTRPVVFGFPDILFTPTNAFDGLIGELESGHADVVLGLFPTQSPNKMDMVETDAAQRVMRIEIKPEQTELELTWILAAWRPTFSQFLLATLADPLWLEQLDGAEAHLGRVFLAAMAHGLSIQSVSFPAGRSLDIGTPNDLTRAKHWLA